LQQIIQRLRGGANIALISDAGTPAISDPGFLLVRECIREGIEVECLPGATAFVPALVMSGIPCDRFCFEGFLPQKKGRLTRLKALSDETTNDGVLRIAVSSYKNIDAICRVFWC